MERKPETVERPIGHSMEIRPIGYFRSPFAQKFGIPRQSGLVEQLEGEIVFESEWRKAEALRGLEDFDFVWIIWGFSENVAAKKSATVRPPLLGGNRRMGVFATRSPFRPNGLGLSCVQLEGLEKTATQGTVIHVLGADLMDGTPIYDIKPYVVYADSRPDAVSGFASEAPGKVLRVVIPEKLPLNARQRKTLEEVLSLDPRPPYQDNPDREYAFLFEGKDVKFRVQGNVLTVIDYGIQTG